MELNPAVRLHWCGFEGESSCVVFEETSGQTYLLDPLRSLMLTLFESGMSYFDIRVEIIQQLQGLVQSGDERVLDDILGEFSSLGLVEESAL